MRHSTGQQSEKYYVDATHLARAALPRWYCWQGAGLQQQS